MPIKNSEIQKYCDEIAQCIEEGELTEPMMVTTIIKRVEKIRELLNVRYHWSTIPPIIKDLFHMIKANKCTSVLKLLKTIPYNAEIMMNLDKHDNTLLHAALLQGTPNMIDVARELLNYACICACINNVNDKGKTPLVILCENYNCDFFVEELIRYGTDVSVVDASWNTALTYACRKGKFSVVSVLLDCDNDCINYKMPNGSTALSLLCQFGNFNVGQQIELVKKMLKYNDIDVSGGVGETPLLCACRSGNSEIAMMILGCRSLDLSRENIGVIIYARDKGMSEVVGRLESLGFGAVRGGQVEKLVGKKNNKSCFKVITEVFINLFILCVIMCVFMKAG